MQTIKGNILDIFREVDEAYLLHGVSCQPVLHAGLAKQIITEYPELLELHRLFIQSRDMLGCCRFYEINSTVKKYIVNLYQQKNVGRDKQQISYTAFESALLCFKKGRSHQDLPVYIPSGIGSGNAGGNKQIIHEIIGRILPEAILVEYRK